MPYPRFLARYLLIGICFLIILFFGIQHAVVKSEDLNNGSNLSAHRGINGEFIVPESIKTIPSFNSASLSRSDQPSWQAEKSPIYGGGIVVPVPTVRSHTIAVKEVGQLRIRDHIHTQNSFPRNTPKIQGVTP